MDLVFRARRIVTPAGERAGAVGVRDGRIVAVEADLAAPVVVELADDEVLLPGLVDTHVHYPQVRVIGALGMPLLEWLERCALPEEQRLADAGYAAEVATEFVGSLVAAGTTDRKSVV